MLYLFQHVNLIELNAVEPENSDIKIFEIIDEDIVSINNNMTNEDK